MTKVAASRQRVIGRSNLHYNAIFLPRATRPTVEAPDRESLGLGKARFLCVFLLLYIYAWFYIFTFMILNRNKILTE